MAEQYMCVYIYVCVCVCVSLEASIMYMGVIQLRGHCGRVRPCGCLCSILALNFDLQVSALQQVKAPRESQIGEARS